MKVLYDCFSCSPYYGSDEGIGWMWPYLMRQYHEIWVLVRKDRKEDIERYCVINDIHDIHFVYCDVPDRMNFYYKRLEKGKNGTYDFLLYQFLWQFYAYREAKRLHRKVRFDIVHHVCTNDFRFLGFMYKLGIPFIIGPIGGAQNTSDGLKYYVRNHKREETIRELINFCVVRMPSYKKAINKAERIYFSNIETRDYLLPYIKDWGKCELLTEIAYYGELENTDFLLKNHNEVVFVWAGRMEYRKGLELLMDVLSRLPMDKEWRVMIYGDGSEKKVIETLCNSLNLQERVVFMGKVPYETLQNAYKGADVFIFPSIRETTGTVILEAMAKGLPVICLNQGGGALLVNEKNGYLISIDEREKCISDFANAMLDCIENPEKIQTLSANAIMDVKNKYLWEQKCRNMSNVYMSLFDYKVKGNEPI